MTAWITITPFPISNIYLLRAIPIKNGEGGELTSYFCMGGLENAILLYGESWNAISCIGAYQNAILLYRGCRKCHFLYRGISKIGKISFSSPPIFKWNSPNPFPIQRQPGKKSLKSEKCYFSLNYVQCLRYEALKLSIFAKKSILGLQIPKSLWYPPQLLATLENIVTWILRFIFNKNETCMTYCTGLQWYFTE